MAPGVVTCGPGMVMVDEAGEFDVVERVEWVGIDAPVYDLDVERTHNFVANGIVTHNSIYKFRGADFRNLHEVRGRVSRTRRSWCSTRTTGRRSASSTRPTR